MNFGYRFLALHLIFIFFLSACGTMLPTPDVEDPSSSDGGLTPIELQAGYGVRGTWFELYFTNPSSPISP